MRTGLTFLDHLAELRYRITELSDISNELFYSELKSLVLWIQSNSKFANAIKKLEEEEIFEYRAVREKETDLHECSLKVWESVRRRFKTRHLQRELDEILSKEQSFKVVDISNKLTGAFIYEKSGDHAFHQLRLLIQGISKSKYREAVSDFASDKGILTGYFQEVYSAYCDEVDLYIEMKNATAWGDWLGLKWVFDEPLFNVSSRLVKRKSDFYVTKDRDVMRLKRVCRYLFDYIGKLVSSTDIVDTELSLRGRIWDDGFRVTGDKLQLGDYGSLIFDKSKRQRGDNGEGTNVAKFLDEIISSGYDGIARGNISSILSGDVSGNITLINRRLADAFIKGSIKINCCVISLGKKGDKRLYFVAKHK